MPAGKKDTVSATERLVLSAMQDILHTIQEGVHIIDAQGRSILYNRAMERIEGLSAGEVLGRHLLEVFPTWKHSDSTLLTAVDTGRTVDQRRQSYLNFKKKRISTLNTTFPIVEAGKIVGAVEIATNYTEVDQLSEKIIDLQQKLINPQKATRSKPRSYTFDMLTGRHPAYLAAIGIAHRAARCDASVLIEGETGTGKELFSQSIHNESARRNQPFIAVNCAALPDSLLEGILFGTTRGSYTGAEDRPGLFEQAHGGTLFLDEINSMSLPLQAKILRSLQEGCIRRIGGLSDLSVDVRVIAATNEPLEVLLKSGTFRKDLYFRLNVITIRVPPLRERPEDIPILVEHFLRHFNRVMGKEVWMLSEELREAFLKYPWTGNVRELQNVIESSMIMVSDEHVLSREHIPARIELFKAEVSCKESEAHIPGRSLTRNRQGAKYFAPVINGPSFQGNLPLFLDAIERELIQRALETEQGNISRAASALGLSRQNLQYKMKQFRDSGKDFPDPDSCS